MKAIVAMSGGVDSSVTAHLLKKMGYEVVGLSFELWDQRGTKNPHICCSLETIEIAKEVARKLHIEHHTIDVRDDFYRYIIEYFCSSYISGITPNPCVLCNKFIKFRFLIQKAEEIGADCIATGHYARIGQLQNTRSKEQKTDKGRFVLKKGVDPKKDQSYFLYVMTQEELSKTVFPLGVFQKKQTKGIAQDLGLFNTLRPESQEICFIGNGKYTDFIKTFSPESLKPGPIINLQGKIIGEHKGIALYTIGQRKKIGISSLKPLYVCGIDKKNNAIIVGQKKDTLKKTFKVKGLNWIAMESPSQPLKARVKIRSTMNEEPAVIIPEKNHIVTVEFSSPQSAPASGQSAVFYDNDTVLGGGEIVYTY
jgi:tRNA-specific 2-thiouridylase